MQKTFSFYEGPQQCPCKREGYKGFSGFHKYWGKKPTEAWRLLIERLTSPREIVLDPFLGSGLIAKECVDRNRRFIGFDINPISIELTELFLGPPEYNELKESLKKIDRCVREKVDEIYRLGSGEIISHFLWESNAIQRVWKKTGRTRIEVSVSVEELHTLEHYACPHLSYLPSLRFFDNGRISSSSNMTVFDLFTPRALRVIDLINKEIDKNVGEVRRALRMILTASMGQMSKMVFAVSKRGKTRGLESNNIEVGSWVIGYWKPDQHFEVNALNCFENKAQKLLNALNKTPIINRISTEKSVQGFFQSKCDFYLSVGDSEKQLTQIPKESVDIILTDPPHGDRIPYLELSEMWNGFLGHSVDFENELVISNAKIRCKNEEFYNKKFAAILTQCLNILKSNGVMAIIFNARSKEHWDSIYDLNRKKMFTFIGHYPMEYSSGSVVQDNRAGGLKTDFVLLYTKGSDWGNARNISEKFSDVAGWSTVFPRKD